MKRVASSETLETTPKMKTVASSEILETTPKMKTVASSETLETTPKMKTVASSETLETIHIRLYPQHMNSMTAVDGRNMEASEVHLF
jgi:hypothetical protein